VQIPFGQNINLKNPSHTRHAHFSVSPKWATRFSFAWAKQNRAVSRGTFYLNLTSICKTMNQVSRSIEIGQNKKQGFDKSDFDEIWISETLF
jgi:hypothetical protein